MTSPFDDPEFRAEMAKLGVTHKPGMAKRMLEDLSPLLASEGIDMDNLDATELEAVNAALASATERHNLTLFTPIGAQRAGAFAVLRQFTIAIADNDLALAQALLGGVPPQGGPTTPAISHVIGVSLGLLDARQTDAALRAARQSMRVPSWPAKPSSAAGRDIAALAAKGRSFDSLNSLHQRHSGLAIFEGGALVVAASVISQARLEGLPVETLARRVLAAGPETARATHAPGAAFRRQPQRDPSPSKSLTREFETWLTQQDEIAATSVRAEMSSFGVLQAIAADEVLRLDDPDDISALLEVLFDEAADADDSGDEEGADAAAQLLATLDDYLHFRLDTAVDPQLWEAVRDELEDVLRGAPRLLEIVLEASEASDAIDPEVRRRTLADVRIVGAVRGLLEWIGSGRAVTPSGAIRLADIQTVAGLIGVSAVGTQKRAAASPATPLDSSDIQSSSPSPIQARSMRDVPPLVTWWDGLLAAGLLKYSATRVYPGPKAAEWLAEPLPSIELAELVAGLFVADTITSAGTGVDPWDNPVQAETIGRLVRALTRDPHDSLDAEDTDDKFPVTPSAAGALTLLQTLEDAGLLQRDVSDSFVVPHGLHSAVARGLMAVLMVPMLNGRGSELDD